MDNHVGDPLSYSLDELAQMEESKGYHRIKSRRKYAEERRYHVRKQTKNIKLLFLKSGRSRRRILSKERKEKELRDKKYERERDRKKEKETEKEKKEEEAVIGQEIKYLDKRYPKEMHQLLFRRLKDYFENKAKLEEYLHEAINESTDDMAVLMKLRDIIVEKRRKKQASDTYKNKGYSGHMNYDNERAHHRSKEIIKIWKEGKFANNSDNCLFGEDTSEIKILDVGCGNGDILAMMGDLLKVQNKKEQLFGVDVDSFHGECVHRFENEITFVKYDGTNLTAFADNTFDFIIALQTLHHIENSQQLKVLTQEISRVLKPRGYILVREHDCNTLSMKYLINLEHHLYSQVLAEHVDVKAYTQYKAHYRTKQEWIRLFLSLPTLVHLPLVNDAIISYSNNITNHYYDRFSKHLSELFYF
ncbi:hypothetical protein RFI_05173 [Reticulomyxa filosa]|uniref:Methyltransferase type 11 domain-containing protein n=1 Tax=Reticulomyxa filosa TaxID=46433 RepID=X6P150_RETFI|nr:hypothetical protein RFI_05173 [Reticulomyxa filosa]|eukprot:ETO31941.1 hypothetical protein RFI_05173 [Reticulomyxa filosa]